MDKLLADKTWLVELASSTSFILMTFLLIAGKINGSTPDVYFWIIIFGIFGFLQTLSLIYRRDLMLLRICMAWTAGSVWTWLTYANKETILQAPMLTIGLCNLFAFAVLCSRATVNWTQLYKEQQ